MSEERKLLEGHVVVTNGTTMGVGRAVAELLVANGAKVVINGRTPEKVEEVVKALGDSARGVAGSATEAETARKIVEAAEELGGVTDMISVAGIVEPNGSNILNITEEDFKRVLDNHIYPAFQLARVVAPILAEKGKGSITITGSDAYTGVYGGTAYPAGKGGVVSLGLAMAGDLKNYGVRVNVICPGARTRMSTGAEYEAHIRDLNRRGVLSDAMMHGSLNVAGPEYVAPLYTYLVSDMAKDVTGKVFNASGCFIAEFTVPQKQPKGYRDAQSNSPYTLEEVDAIVHR